MIVYIWAKRNEDTLMNLLGIFTFNAPYLPWVLMGLSLLLHPDPRAGQFWGPILSDLLGITVGHLYYYFHDVFPRPTPNKRRFNPLATPRILYDSKHCDN